MTVTPAQHPPPGAHRVQHLCTCGDKLTGWTDTEATAVIHARLWLRVHTGPGHEPAAPKQYRAARNRKAAHVNDRSLSTCADCRAPIRWVTREDGRRMPLDAEPDHPGTVLLAATRDGIRARVLHPRDVPRVGGLLFVPHRSTCTARTRKETA